MPLVTFDEVKPFIQSGLHATLQNNMYFQTYEDAAAIIIRDRTGIEIPDDAEDAPDWVITPAAWIIQKLASARMPSKSDEFTKALETNYGIAMKILDDKHIQGSPAELVYAKQITLDNTNY